MLTAEIKVNGALVAHMYMVNEVDLGYGRTKYRYEIYHPDESIIKGWVSHSPMEGTLELIRLILEKEKK